MSNGLAMCQIGKSFFFLRGGRGWKGLVLKIKKEGCLTTINIIVIISFLIIYILWKYYDTKSLGWFQLLQDYVAIMKNN